MLLTKVAAPTSPRRNTVLQRPEVNSIDLNFSHLSRECQMPKDMVKFIYLRMLSVIERVVR